jgi:hypothetical protein
MHVLLVQTDDVDLYATLLKSETSRAVLKFYRPDRLDYGVRIRTTSLGSALSLISELRWYIRRYVKEVLFEVSHPVYCTQALAGQFYERDVKIESSWNYRRIYVFRGSELAYSSRIQDSIAGEDYRDRCEPKDTRLEIWCTEEEFRVS